jgi:hypothetical protein
MGPSKKHRDDAADERRQYAADQYVRAEKADKKAEEAERRSAQETGGGR